MRNIHHPRPFDEYDYDYYYNYGHQQNPNTNNNSTTAAAAAASAAARKRQRRQAAASFLFPTATVAAAAPAVVPAVTSQLGMGRKSTAQPRPVLHVPPRGIGPIVEPNPNDVLCGRGGRINSHTGNIQFRDMVNARKKEYLAKSTKKLEKAHIAAKIVEEIRSMDPPGRFLKEDSSTGLWWDIGDQKAIKKSGQALREDAPDIRHEIDGSDSGDNNNNNDETKKTTTSTKKSDDVVTRTDAESKPAAAEQGAAEPKVTVSSPKIHIPKGPSAPSTTTTRPNVTTPVISNNSRGIESPSLQELPPAGIPSPNVATQQQHEQQQSMQSPPQVFLVNDAGAAGLAYPMQGQSSQQHASFPIQQYVQQFGVAGQPFVIIPFPQQQSQANPPSAATSTSSNTRNSPNIYAVPSQLFQGVKSFAQRATNYSERASEVMQAPQPHPFASAVSPAGLAGGGADDQNNSNIYHNLMTMGRRPPSNVAFGRTFHPPTELSSGSTMSTISGLSSVMGPEGSLLSLNSHRSLGMGGSSVLSGMDYVDQLQQQQQQQASPSAAAAAVAMARANTLRNAQMMQDQQRRLSQLSEFRSAGGSDLTFSLRSLGSLSRSQSFPDLSNSIRDEMRRFEEAFANANNNNHLPSDMSLATTVNMAPSSIAPPRTSPQSSENPSSLGDGTATNTTASASAGDEPSPQSDRVIERPPLNRNRSISTASAMSLSVASMSLASGVSRGSINSLNRYGLPDDSNRSIFSDLSNDINALDLAAAPR